MKIGGLQKTTLIDFPGHVACAVFLIGCNFRCPFCHNPELVEPSLALKLPEISEKEFFEFLKSREGFLNGVVVTGGEPTIYKDLPAFIGKIKKLGFDVKLDTNGSNTLMVKHLIAAKMVDYVAMDIKAPRENYAAAAGLEVDIKNVQETIDILKLGDVEYEFRTTVVPGIHTFQDLEKIAKWLGQADKYYIQQFRPGKNLDSKFEKIQPFSPGDLMKIQLAAAPYFKEIHIR